MAKILIIKSGYERAGIDSPGDIVAIHDDSHNFTDGDLSRCEVFQIVGVTRMQVVDYLSQNQSSGTTKYSYAIRKTGQNTLANRIIIK